MPVRAGRFWTLGLAAAGAIGASILAAFIFVPADTAGPCALVNGPAALPEIPEASGLTISRRNAGVIWSHNDSGHAAVLFALDTAGNLRGRVRLPIRTRDWEDVSAGRCASGDCLYVADIGDNSVARSRIQIYRVPEPLPADSETAQPEAFSATYADGPHNAEAMFVIGEDLFIITRDRTGGVYRSTVVSPGSHELTFRRISQLGLAAVTDAEATPDEKTVVVRTSDEALLYRAAEIASGRAAAYLRIPIGRLREAQGEGVALGANGKLYLASEGGPRSGAGSFIQMNCTLTQ